MWLHNCGLWPQRYLGACSPRNFLNVRPSESDFEAFASLGCGSAQSAPSHTFSVYLSVPQSNVESSTIKLIVDKLRKSMR